MQQQSPNSNPQKPLANSSSFNKTIVMLVIWENIPNNNDNNSFYIRVVRVCGGKWSWMLKIVLIFYALNTINTCVGSTKCCKRSLFCLQLFTLTLGRCRILEQGEKRIFIRKYCVIFSYTDDSKNTVRKMQSS